VTPTLNGGRILDFLDQDDHRDDPYLAYICQAPGLRASASAVARRSSARPAKTCARAPSLACNKPVNVFN